MSNRVSEFMAATERRNAELLELAHQTGEFLRTYGDPETHAMITRMNEERQAAQVKAEAKIAEIRERSATPEPACEALPFVLPVDVQ